ncbi:probable serine/threonine protein kinase IREH1 isoform X1 [Salvia splendens]|uniref:probable serine/threonine protein kinase IREH1 isoform X1 n=1 Tax=Salvia splendens TaxID=180675 RepID=UPI001C26F4E7|nr:probable serine/threonine protein kinase IREH1 isoform X1 [Salvia splendens]
MVFKGRFFSSKKSDTSSLDGSSNTPRSFGSNSNSPIRSDKKKTKSPSPSLSKDTSPSPSAATTPKSAAKSLLKKKDSLKGKESPNSSPSQLKKSEPPPPSSGPSSLSVSPLVASSLGLNKIKTRSGPLPQESFFNFGTREKGVSLGASNLSRPLVGGGIGGSDGRKKKEKSFLENADNGSNSDTMSTESGASRDQSPHVLQVQERSRLQNAESSSGATGQFGSSWDDSGALRNSDACTPETKTYDCDNPKESESPRFQAILRVTSAPRKRFPGDIKSFSHELNSKGVRPYPFWKPRRLNNLEEVLAMIRTKFDKAKEEVDADLHIFAADLVGILEKNSETHPDWQETIEDLLVLARTCAMSSSGEFWLQCEGIVQELDDRRQELPMGTLKQLHTRMLFILTRCTRLLQFHKESGLAEDDHVFPLRQSLQPADKHIPPGPGKDGKFPLDVKAVKTPSTRKFYSQEQSEWKKDHAVRGNLQPSLAESTKNVDSAASRNRMASWKKFPSPSGKSPKEATSVKEESSDSIMQASKTLNNSTGINNAELATDKVPVLPSSKEAHPSSTMPKHQHKPSWGYWGDQPSVSDESSIICRICEEEVPTLHVEDHSRICAIADRCDQKGLRVNERLTRIAETLEKLMESFSAKDVQHGVGSPDGAKASNSSVTEELELLSPKYSDWSRRGSEDMLDCFAEPDNSTTDDMKASMSCKTRFGPKSDQGMTTSSAGSMTPRSPLMTPRMSPIDLLLSGKGAFSEHGDLPQMNELADIAKCVANTPLDDDRSLQYLLSCLEDLKVVTERRKFDSLTVETFGARIEKLIREKYLQLCELVDDDKVDITSTVIDEDAPLEDDVLRSLRSSPVHSSKDRTSIDDFEIIKPISRGAFGRVFLAKKRTTGDLFAIKVLKKADMIRKNAVESILAERDILISVRNPFVVRFFYSFTCRDNLYLVMEYLNGGDLYSMLRNLGCLDEDVARIYIAEVVLALEYLHSLRVVHRDLKPDNLLIAHDGHIKLTDFGLSKVGLINSTDDLSGPAVSETSLMEEDEQPFSASEHQQERRKKRSAVGTPDYLAPEILLGTGHGFTADWWSVGVILFELIVGIPPFNAEHPQKIFDNILNRNIPWPVGPDELSYEAFDLIDRLLTEDPNQRLGAVGASEVKEHPFFRDINWDTLARQKAAFVPASEGATDTSYFTSRYSWNTTDEHVYAGSDFEDSSDNGSLSGGSSCLSNRHEEVQGDECEGLTELDSSNDINYSFSNFSFKNLSQLASINYDLLTKGWKDDPPTNSST